MSDTFFFPDTATAEQRRRIADLDRRLPEPREYSHYEKTRLGWAYVSPEGGLYSTATDLRQFLLLFRHGGQVPGRPRVLSAGSIARLMRDEVPAQNVDCDGRVGYTLGFLAVRDPGCAELPGLSPETIFHYGRFSTEFWYDPRKDEIAIFLYQIVTGDDSTPSLAERDAFKQMLARIPTL